MTVLVFHGRYDSAPLPKEALLPEVCNAFVEGHCPRDMRCRARTPLRDVHAHRHWNRSETARDHAQRA